MSEQTRGSDLTALIEENQRQLKELRRDLARAQSPAQQAIIRRKIAQLQDYVRCLRKELPRKM